MKHTHYTETQTGWIFIACIAVVSICLAIRGVMVGDATTHYTLAVVVFLTAVPFYQMRTTLNDNYLEVSYGVGIVKRKIALSMIAQAETRSIPWYVGAGIKFYKSGTLYSINYTRAVELSLKGSERKISIGSRTPELLLEQIQRLRTNI